MNEAYLNLMTEVKKKDEKAYSILEKIKNHPVHAFLHPYNTDTVNGMLMLLFAPIIAQIATLFAVPQAKGGLLLLILVSFALELAGIWLTSSYFSTVWARRKKSGADSIERLPIYCMCFGVFCSVLYIIICTLRSFAPGALIINTFIAEALGYSCFLFNLLSFVTYAMTLWGYSRDLSVTLLSKEEHSYLNAFFEKNAERNTEGNITARYAATDEGVIYYKEGNKIILVPPFGNPNNELIKTIREAEGKR